MMVTNKNLEKGSELHAAGERLLAAAYEYWQLYQTHVGPPSAVVWLKDDTGHFVLFSRGEYVADFMGKVDFLQHQEPLERVFEAAAPSPEREEKRDEPTR